MRGRTLTPVLKGRSRLMIIGRRAALVAGLGLFAACGDGDGAATQTTLLMTPTNYVTQPPTPTTTTTTTVPGQTLPPGAPAVTVPEEQVYTVQAGDYGLKVAKLFGLTWDELRAYNAWDDQNDFPQPGGTVRIPPGSALPTTTLAPPSTSGAPGPTSSTTAPPTTVDASAGGTYTIKDGDIPIRVAQSFDITLEQLAAANGWSGEPSTWPFIVGKTIKIPAKTG